MEISCFRELEHRTVFNMGKVMSLPKTTACHTRRTLSASEVSYERKGPTKRSKFSEEEIVYAIRQAEAGVNSPQTETGSKENFVPDSHPRQVVLM